MSKALVRGIIHQLMCQYFRARHTFSVVVQYKFFFSAFLNCKERRKLVPISYKPVVKILFRPDSCIYIFFILQALYLVKQKQNYFPQTYSMTLLLCKISQTCRLLATQRLANTSYHKLSVHKHTTKVFLRNELFGNDSLVS